MTIKTFAEYQTSVTQLFDTKEAYDAGVEEASKHFEEEKIKIHEYYDKAIKKPEKKPKQVKTPKGKIEEPKEEEPKDAETTV